MRSSKPFQDIEKVQGHPGLYKTLSGQTQWCKPVVPVFRRLKPEGPPRCLQNILGNSGRSVMGGANHFFIGFKAVVFPCKRHFRCFTCAFTCTRCFAQLEIVRKVRLIKSLGWFVLIINLTNSESWGGWASEPASE